MQEAKTTFEVGALSRVWQVTVVKQGLDNEYVVEYIVPEQQLSIAIERITSEVTVQHLSCVPYFNYNLVFPDIWMATRRQPTTEDQPTPTPQRLRAPV